MSYIPPHKRSIQPIMRNTPKKSNLPKKEEFPELVSQEKKEKKETLNFSKLFQKSREKRERKKLKEGWIKLTKQGVYDSLTEKQREQQDYLDNKYRMDTNIYNLLEMHKKNRELRYEKNGYCSDYSVNTNTDEEIEEYEEEINEFDDEFECNNEIIDDQFSKWDAS